MKEEEFSRRDSLDDFAREIGESTLHATDPLTGAPDATMDSLKSRLNHPHYYACALLSLPLPVWLAVRLAASSTLTTALLAAPVLLALSVVARRPPDNLGELLAPRTDTL